MQKFAQFTAAYPVTRRKGGDDARRAFAQALRKVPFALMLHALDQHKRSEQWQNPRFIPSMTTWLLEERWIQVLPETPPVSAEDADRIRKRQTPWQHAKRLGLK
jgi:hypothetical protein